VHTLPIVPRAPGCATQALVAAHPTRGRAARPHTSSPRPRVHRARGRAARPRTTSPVHHLAGDCAARPRTSSPAQHVARGRAQAQPRPRRRAYCAPAHAHRRAGRTRMELCHAAARSAACSPARGRATRPLVAAHSTGGHATRPHTSSSRRPRSCHAAAHRSPRTRVHSATRPRPRPRSRLCHAAAHLVGAQLAGGRAACRRTSPPRTASLAVAPLSRAHVAEDITHGRSARPRAQRPPTCRSTHCEPRHGRACRTAWLRGGSRVRTQAGPRDCIVEQGAARFGCERDDHVVLTPANVSLCRLPLYVLV
jgi:hypothetical protein